VLAGVFQPGPTSIDKWCRQLAFSAACRCEDAHERIRVRPAAPNSRNRQRSRSSSIQYPCHRWFRLWTTSPAHVLASPSSAGSSISCIAKLAVVAENLYACARANESTTREPCSGLSGQMPSRLRSCCRRRASGVSSALHFTTRAARSIAADGHGVMRSKASRLLALLRAGRHVPLTVIHPDLIRVLAVSLVDIRFNIIGPAS
jgi:hypothetical protein